MALGNFEGSGYRKSSKVSGSELWLSGRPSERCGVVKLISSDRSESRESLRSSTDAMVLVAQWEEYSSSENVVQISVTSLKDTYVFLV